MNNTNKIRKRLKIQLAIVGALMAIPMAGVAGPVFAEPATSGDQPSSEQAPEPGQSPTQPKDELSPEQQPEASPGTPKQTDPSVVNPSVVSPSTNDEQEASQSEDASANQQAKPVLDFNELYALDLLSGGNLFGFGGGGGGYYGYNEPSYYGYSQPYYGYSQPYYGYTYPRYAAPYDPFAAVLYPFYTLISPGVYGGLGSA